MRNRKRHIQNFKIFFNVSYFCRVMRTEQYNYRWVQEPNRFIHTLNINSKASYDQYTFMVVEQNKYEQIILPPFLTNFHIVTIVLSDWQQHLMRTEESPCRISFIIMIFFFIVEFCVFCLLFRCHICPLSHLYLPCHLLHSYCTQRRGATALSPQNPGEHLVNERWLSSV